MHADKVPAMEALLPEGTKGQDHVLVILSNEVLRVDRCRFRDEFLKEVSKISTALIMLL
ncbi:hypothetical protein MASR1M65_25240 [Saprospiraceae bacterium]